MEKKVQMELKVKLVSQDQKVLVEIVEIVVPVDRKEIPVLWDSRERKVHKDQKVPEVYQDIWVNKETLVTKEPVDPEDLWDPQVYQDQ